MTTLLFQSRPTSSSEVNYSSVDTFTPSFFPGNQKQLGRLILPAL